MALTYTRKGNPAVSVLGGGTNDGTPSVDVFGTTAEWTAENPVLGVGEVGYNTTTKDLRVGDGVTRFLSLASAGSTTYVQAVPVPVATGVVATDSAVGAAAESAGR